MSTVLRTPEPTDEQLKQTLKEAKTIAVVGLSDDPLRPSYGVAKYLQDRGYRIIPVNPKCTYILGEKVYPDLLSIPFDIDIVDVFRRPSAVAAHVDEAIRKGTKLIWLQLGIRNDEAAQEAREAGIDVVQDRCLKIEHMRLVRH